MALLPILHFPNPELAVKAKKVEKIDDYIRQLVTDMYETMYDARGVGLAATQVGIHLQLFTMDVSEEHDQPMCVINPEILSQEGLIDEGEGCLSVPGAYDKVPRAAKVRLRAMNLEGETFELEAEGLMAHCIQHEVDHLQGILFINHLSKLKQSRIRTKMLKMNKR